MRFQRLKGMLGGTAAGVLTAAGVTNAGAVDDEFFSNLAGDIRGSVLDAVGSSGNSGGTISAPGAEISGGESSGGQITGESSSQSDSFSLDDTPGTTIADASGGNSNFSFVS